MQREKNINAYTLQFYNLLKIKYINTYARVYALYLKNKSNIKLKRRNHA